VIVIVGQSLIIVHCLHLLYIVSFCDNYSFILFFSDSILHYSTPLSNCFIINSVQFCVFQFNCFSFNYFSITTWLLFDHCLIIVRYSDPGNVFQVFQSPNWSITCNFKSINIIQSKIRLLPSQHRVLRRPIATIDMSGIYGTNFSHWDRGEQDNNKKTGSWKAWPDWGICISPWLRYLALA
jgi:hypothetical protein